MGGGAWERRERLQVAPDIQLLAAHLSSQDAHDRSGAARPGRKQQQQQRSASPASQPASQPCCYQPPLLLLLLRFSLSFSPSSFFCFFKGRQKKKNAAMCASGGSEGGREGGRQEQPISAARFESCLLWRERRWPASIKPGPGAAPSQPLSASRRGKQCADGRTSRVCIGSLAAGSLPTPPTRGQTNKKPKKQTIIIRSPCN